jgi:aminoglycoside phosphotransferase family enzyme
MEELAAKLAAFHTNGSIAKSKVWGSVQAIARLIENNLAEAKELAADSVTQNGVATAGEYLRSYIMTHQRLLENRARKGWVRDGHGDLRCDSICFLPERLVIIDCVEYSEALRYVDVASEVAALAVDLEMAGRQELSDGLIAGYIRASKDINLPELLHFYKCYRALMRGKLEALVSLQAELPLERRMLARNNASRSFAMARRLATAVEQ